MAVRYAAGALSNLLARGTLSCNPAESTPFPKAGACDDDPKPFRWGSLAADSYWELRNNSISDPSFETLSGTVWVDADTGTGASAQGPAGSGRAGGATKCLRCAAGAAGVAARYERIEVPAGEYGRIDMWCLPGLGRTGSVRIFCEETGHWYVAGVWQAAEGDAGSVTNVAAWTRVAVTTLQVEAFSVALWPTVHLRIYFRSADNGDVDFDDVAWIPGVNAGLAHGHNFRPCVVPTWRYSDDAFAADDNVAATSTIYRPSFYSYLAAPVYREYWRFRIGGTNTEIPGASEFWLGYLSELTVAQEDGWSVTRLPIVTAPDDLTSADRVRTRNDRPRQVKLSFEHWTEAEWTQVINDIDERSHGGQEPVILVPSTTSNEARVIYGRIDPDRLQLVRENPVIWRDSLTMTEMGFSRDLA